MSSYVILIVCFVVKKNLILQTSQRKMKDIIGKGNAGMYIDRSPTIYAAGVRSLQPDVHLAECFNNYRDASDNIKYKSYNLPKYNSTKSLLSQDMRNAGPYTEGSKLINPSTMTKFESLVEDIKCTVYKSYWNKQVGIGKVSCLPHNLDINNTIFGKKTVHLENVYDVIMPNSNISNKVLSENPGQRSEQNYCKYIYNPNKIHGTKTNADRSGIHVKRCLTDERIIMGTSLKQPINMAQEKFRKSNNAELGISMSPNENVNCVPEGYVFGKLEPKNNSTGCFSYCEINPKRELFMKCLTHVNTLRKCLSKKFDGSFFRNFYLELKFIDKSMSGWLPKDLLYQLCTTKYIRFNSNLIEPLLEMWSAVNDLNIKYKTFINVINYREPLPLLPKVPDISSKCTNFTTTYTEMVKQEQLSNISMAGVPSGRFFDTDFPKTSDSCCKTDRRYLPHESDAKACLCLSIFTLMGVSNRDMYAVREPEIVKKVFKCAGETFTDDIFNVVWREAMKYHTKGLVSYETFRRALDKYKSKTFNN